MARLVMNRKRKGCKTIINCEHKEEKHYARVNWLIVTNTLYRECVIYVTTKMAAQSWLMDANIRMILIIPRAFVNLAISYNTQR